MDIVLRIYGDSLGLPRPAQDISGLDTYPELFKRELEKCGNRVALYNRSVGGISVKRLREAWDKDRPYFEKGHEILVIQCGIVDCAPRPLNRTLRACVGRLPKKARNSITNFLHRNRAALLSRGLRSRVTTPPVFESVYSRWLQAAAETADHVFVLNIAPTTPQIASHSPGLSESIAIFNKIIETSVRNAAQNVVLADVHQAIVSKDQGLERYIAMEDGYHITKAGHELYAHLIYHQASRMNCICTNTDASAPALQAVGGES